MKEHPILFSAPMVMAILNNKVAEILETHMLSYKNEIEKAYCLEDGGLLVNLSVKFGAVSNAGVEVKTGISFVASKIKDGEISWIDENQLPMFPEEA